MGVRDPPPSPVVMRGGVGLKVHKNGKTVLPYFFCFRPKLKRSSAFGEAKVDDDEESKKGGSSDDFISRMEGQERKQRNKREEVRGEIRHSMRLNNRMCHRHTLPLLRGSRRS